MEAMKEVRTVTYSELEVMRLLAETRRLLEAEKEVTLELMVALDKVIRDAYADARNYHRQMPVWASLEIGLRLLERVSDERRKELIKLLDKKSKM